MDGAIQGMLDVSIEQGITPSPEALKTLQRMDRDLSQTIFDAYHLIQISNNMRTDSQKLIQGAIRGIMRKVDPEGGLYLPDNFRPDSGGIGLQIAQKNNQIVVIAPIDDSPAERAGIQSGDIILNIDGKAVFNSSLYDVVQLLRGSMGTPIALTIKREPKGAFDLTLVREAVKYKSVKHKIIENKIGYIKIMSFNENTSYDLGIALKKLNEADIKAIILDLRNSPGALFEQAVEVCDHFLKKGELVTRLKGRKKSTEYFTQNGSVYPNFQLILLVNEVTAAGAEIVAAALQENNRATIVGIKTFGRGSVQSLIPLNDGLFLRLTSARFYTPQGRAITGEGITPDVIVDVHRLEDNTVALIQANQKAFGEPKTDVQLQRAMNILQQTIKVFP